MKNEIAYTLEDFAAALGRKRWWVHEQIKRQGLPYFKIGRNTYIRRADADKWLEQFPVKCGLDVETAPKKSAG
ncbi:helix-turn-helix domain-containing protein [Hyphomicrobium sp. B1]|uniref:helix-turn-helix domain-containing protein n=1 Tax=Hyphomicrobium sp. B1 TaxID=3075651 RepID=UPI003C2D5F02